jgi:hypothetical protein
MAQGQRKARGGLVLAVALFLAGCGTPGLGPFDQRAYENAVSVKFETLGLVDRAGERFTVRKAEADQLSLHIETAYAYASGLPNNQLSTQAWQVIRDPQGGSAGGFLRLWRDKGSLPASYRTEKKRQLAQQFDYVVCLEANKQAPATCPNPIGTGP